MNHGALMQYRRFVIKRETKLKNFLDLLLRGNRKKKAATARAMPREPSTFTNTRLAMSFFNHR
jgi:hypothetical protein